VYSLYWWRSHLVYYLGSLPSDPPNFIKLLWICINKPIPVTLYVMSNSLNPKIITPNKFRSWLNILFLLSFVKGYLEFQMFIQGLKIETWKLRYRVALPLNRNNTPSFIRIRRVLGKVPGSATINMKWKDILMSIVYFPVWANIVIVNTFCY
jgi:hypothetical protein